MVQGPVMSRQDVETSEKQDVRGGPFDANNTMDTDSPERDELQQSRAISTKTTMQEVSKVITSTRNDAGTPCPTENMAMEDDGHTVTGYMEGNGTGTEKQPPARPHTQNILRDDSHDRSNGKHSNKTYDYTVTQEDPTLSLTDMETHAAPAIMRPKRNKKLKTDREAVHSRDRTGSRTCHKTPQKM